jgi:hypothetical protein
VARNRQIVEETLHLMETRHGFAVPCGCARSCRPRNSSAVLCAPWWTAASGPAASTTGSSMACPD